MKLSCNLGDYELFAFARNHGRRSMCAEQGIEPLSSLVYFYPKPMHQYLPKWFVVFDVMIKQNTPGKFPVILIIANLHRHSTWNMLLKMMVYYDRAGMWILLERWSAAPGFWGKKFQKFRDFWAPVGHFCIFQWFFESFQEFFKNFVYYDHDYILTNGIGIFTFLR